MIKHFKDEKGRKWAVNVTVGSIERVLKETEIDLLALDDKNVFIAMSTEIRKIVQVLFALLRPDIEALDMSPEEFGEGLAGDSLERAIDALTESWINFFPSSSPKRRALKTALTETKKFEAKIAELAQSPEMKKALQDALTEVLDQHQKSVAESFSRRPASSE